MNPIKFYRVRDWIKNLGIPLVGILSTRLDLFSIFFSLILSSLCLAYAFSINNFYDMKNIRNKKGFLILSIIPLIISFIISFFFSMEMLLFTLGFTILYTLYSMNPIRLKKHWIFSLTINTFCLGVLLLLIGLYSVSNTLSLISFTFLMIYSSFILTSEIIHQIAHVEEDKKERINSFPIAFGIKNSLKLVKFIQLLLLVFLLFVIFSNPKINFIFFPTIIFCFLRFVKINSLNLNDVNFSKLRTKMYGLQEGTSYVIILILKDILVLT